MCHWDRASPLSVTVRFVTCVLGLALLLGILDLAAIRGVFPRKKRSQPWGVHLPIGRTVLIGLQVVDRLPYTDGEAPIGIVYIPGEPAAPEPLGLFAREGLLVHPLEFVPGVRIQLAQVIRIIMMDALLRLAVCGCVGQRGAARLRRALACQRPLQYEGDTSAAPTLPAAAIPTSDL
jgi:hypothetical protein